MSLIEKALLILRETNDGNDLARCDLLLLQRIVNACVFRIAESDEVEFDKLYSMIEKGEYGTRWFNGIEHLTMDAEGYVYWKGNHVEHYSGSLGIEGHPKSIKASEELARRCRILDSEGKKVSCNSAIWLWNEESNQPQKA